MLDLKFVRQNPDLVRQAIENKGEKVDLSRFLELDQEHLDPICTTIETSVRTRVRKIGRS